MEELQLHNHDMFSCHRCNEEIKDGDKVIIYNISILEDKGYPVALHKECKDKMSGIDLTELINNIRYDLILSNPELLREHKC